MGEKGCLEAELDRLVSKLTWRQSGLQLAPREIQFIKSVKLLISVRCLRHIVSRYSRGAFSGDRRRLADFMESLGYVRGQETVFARAALLNIPGLRGWAFPVLFYR